jgi:hypothetical protein
MLGRILRKIRSDGPGLVALRQLEKLGRPVGFSPISYVYGADPGLQNNVREVSPKEQFEVIAEGNLWNSDESVSGGGSELSYTAPYRKELVEQIRSRGWRTFFDAPSGDFNWMSHVVRETGIAYIGGDIAPSVIARNRAGFPEHEWREFDITSDPFPAADVWQCRDCMFHLPNELIDAALRNFAQSGIPYALMTSHQGWFRNADIRPGGFRYLDLTKAPFRLPEPEASLTDYRKGKDFPRIVGLWSREQIARHLGL